MSKPATLHDEAWEALKANQRPDESLSDVILRFVPRPIRTFEDLEKHLATVDGPILSDQEALERIRKRKE